MTKRPIFSMLGTVSIQVAGHEVALETPMVRAFVAALLQKRNSYVSLEHLSRDLWHAQPASALPNVRKYATRLRARLAEADNALAERFSSQRRSGYRLYAEREEVDAVRFTDLAAHGHAQLSAGDHATAAALLHEALELWQGEAGHSLPALSPIRAELALLNEQRQLAAADLVDARLALGDTTVLIPQLRASVAERPVDERAWAQLIQALHRSGAPGAALDAYSRARAHLRDELGIEPSLELRSLQRAVLNRDTALVSLGF